MKQMNSPNVEFLMGLELESMWQAEEQSNSDKAVVEKLEERSMPLENVDLVLTLLHVANPELLRNDGMKGTMCFNLKLFDRSTVVMIFECFKNLLEMAVEAPHKVVWDLPMLTRAEKQKQVVDWNKTAAPCPKPGWLVHEFFLDQVEANPNAIALVEYGGLKRNISYEELRTMAEKVARQIRVLGVEGDSIVGLLMTNDSAEAIASIYGRKEFLKLVCQRIGSTNRKTYSHAGILIAGGACVPLDPSYPAARIKLIAEDSGLKTLLVKDEDALAEHSSAVKCPVLSVTHILNDAFLTEPSDVDCHQPTPSNSCYIIYTSGTTGKPKGVVLNHANMSSFTQYGALCMHKGLGPGSQFLLSSPITFVMSCSIQFPTLSMGATLVVAPKLALLDELEVLINTMNVSSLACHTRNITCMLKSI